jgi:hypothetical protein
MWNGQRPHEPAKNSPNRSILPRFGDFEAEKIYERTFPAKPALFRHFPCRNTGIQII